jgi:hypothetical protein
MRSLFLVAGLLGCVAAARADVPPAEVRRQVSDELKKWKESKKLPPGDDGERAAARERLDRIIEAETRRDLENEDFDRRLRRPGEEKASEGRPPRERTPPPETRPAPDSRPAPPPSRAGAGAAAGKAIFWTVVIVVVGALLAGLVYLLLTAPRSEKEEAETAGNTEIRRREAAGELPVVHRDPDEWLADARRLAAQGRFLEALRCLLLASLERLHRARAIDWEKARTNRECLRQFRGEPQPRARFAALVDAFDVAVYGRAPVREAEYLRAEEEARELGREVPVEGVG